MLCYVMLCYITNNWKSYLTINVVSKIVQEITH